MKASELIAQLQTLVEEHGDLEIFLPRPYDPKSSIRRSGFKKAVMARMATLEWDGEDSHSVPPQIQIV